MTVGTSCSKERVERMLILQTGGIKPTDMPRTLRVRNNVLVEIAGFTSDS